MLLLSIFRFVFIRFDVGSRVKMASANNDEGSNGKGKGNNNRRWTEDELNIFAEVLADESNQFCLTLEKLALKKAANNEVFEHMLIEVNRKMSDESFIKIYYKKGKKKLKELELSIDKLYKI